MPASGRTTSGRRYTGIRKKYRRAKVRYRVFRARVARNPVLDLTYRITMAISSMTSSSTGVSTDGVQRRMLLSRIQSCRSRM